MTDFAKRLKKWSEKKAEADKIARHDVLMLEFLAVKNDIIKAIEDGYSIKTIWLFFKENGNIQFCYGTFCRYVRRFISAPSPQYVAKKDPKNLKQSIAPTAKLNKAEEKKSPPKPKPDSPGFKYNRTPNEKDLI